MAIMSYCRFHNTRLYVEDCIDTIVCREHISEEELGSCESMFEMIIDFLADEGIVEVVEDAFEERIESLKERNE